MTAIGAIRGWGVCRYERVAETTRKTRPRNDGVRGIWRRFRTKFWRHTRPVINAVVRIEQRSADGRNLRELGKSPR